jgi:predicted O-linked N-acetylglucosamine transferase (SPINDLY family)
MDDATAVAGKVAAASRPPAALLQEAMRLHTAGRLDAARSLYEQILSIEPAHFDATHLLGVVRAQAGDPRGAIKLLAAAVQMQPGNAAAHVNYGQALLDAGKAEAALTTFQRAMTLAPRMAEPYALAGRVLVDLGRAAEALDPLTQALALKRDFADAHYTQGLALRALQRPQAALASFDRAIALKGGFAEAFCGRGLALEDLGDLEAALASHEQAIALNSAWAGVHYNRGVILKKMRRFKDAAASYERAIELRNDYADAHCNRGNALRDLGDAEQALLCYERAIALQPESANAHANLANLLRELGRYESAVASFDAALAHGTADSSVRAMRLHTKMHIAQWDDFDTEVTALTSALQRGEAAVPPFCLLGLTDCAELQKQCAENWARAHCPPSDALGNVQVRHAGPKIRLGYFSADFREHPVAALTAGLFESHDRTQFEVFGFSFGPETGDATRRRLRSAFDRFFDVRYRSDRQIAALAREHGVDIAIDLGGFTSDARPGILALRVAPVQLSYIGYLGTMGAPYIDYMLADRTLVPNVLQRHYAEKIVYLPSYQANDSKRIIAGPAPSRAELGLPSDAVVFCCFNANYKITPQIFHSWMRILQSVSGSVLLLYAGSEAAARNFRNEATRRGVAPERLVICGKLPFAQYLARFRAADLFLDTSPYNAGTTASDALWAGLPVLTCAGEALASRMGASLLTAAGLSELIAETPLRYEERAVELAADRKQLFALREKVEASRISARLFDTLRFTRGLERAFHIMRERSLNREAPESIEVLDNPVG